MNEMFSQGGKGSTGILTNKQAIARKFGVKQNEVVYFAVGVDLGGYKVIYDKTTQRAYSLPVLPVGTTAVSLNEHAVLVHSAGTVDLGELAATRREFVSLSDSFATGLVVNTRNEILMHNDIGYTYLGSLPVTIASGTNPVGNVDWKPQTGPTIRDDLSSHLDSLGDAMIGVKQPFTGSSPRTQHDFNSDYVSLRDFASPDDPVLVGEGNADVDSAAIQRAFASGCLRIDFLNLDLKVNTWFILPQGIHLRNCGSIEQTLWGYPVFEQRYPAATLHGMWRGKYTGDRTVVISTNTLGYGYVTSGDWKAYGSFIWQNYYEGKDVSQLHVDSLHVSGFIAGIWLTGANANIGSCYFDTVDFGVFGVVKNNQRIGMIYHKNITASQGHEGHALYTNGTGKGLLCGPVYVDGSPFAGSPVKIHTTKNFRIESISGVGLASIAYFMDGATGTIGSINCVCDVDANFTGPGQDPSQYNILVSGAGTDVKVTGGVYIEANQQGVVKTACVQASGTVARITFEGAFKYVNTNSSPQQPITAFMTSGGDIRFLSGVEIEHPNSLCTSIIFNLLGASNFICLVPPKVICGAGAEVLLLRNTYTGTGAGNNYKLAYDPALIYPGVGPNIIQCTQNIYFGVLFHGTGNVFNSVTGATPVVTHTAQANITQTTATDITRLRYMSPGQRLLLRNTDGNTNIGHNKAPGLDGNIITNTGADISRTSWKFATFAKLGGSDINVYLIGLV